MKERFETFTVLIAKISRNIRKIKNQEMAEYNLRGSPNSALRREYAPTGKQTGKPPKASFVRLRN